MATQPSSHCPDSALLNLQEPLWARLAVPRLHTLLQSSPVTQPDRVTSACIATTQRSPNPESGGAAWSTGFATCGLTF